VNIQGVSLCKFENGSLKMEEKYSTIKVEEILSKQTRKKKKNRDRLAIIKKMKEMKENDIWLDSKKKGT
jgi:hypothetical protein